MGIDTQRCAETRTHAHVRIGFSIISEEEPAVVGKKGGFHRERSTLTDEDHFPWEKKEGKRETRKVDTKVSVFNH